MAGKYLRIAKKLQTACRKIFGVKLLINQRQWFSNDKDMAITVYTVNEVKLQGEGKRDASIELFRTYSQVQLVLFMRDYWYQLNGWEVPHDNQKWEEIKARYGQTREPSDEAPSKRASVDGEYYLDQFGAGIFD